MRAVQPVHADLSTCACQFLIGCQGFCFPVGRLPTLFLHVCQAALLLLVQLTFNAR